MKRRIRLKQSIRGQRASHHRLHLYRLPFLLFLPHRNRAGLHNRRQNPRCAEHADPAPEMIVRASHPFCFPGVPLLLTQNDGPDLSRFPGGGRARFFLRARDGRREGGALLPRHRLDLQLVGHGDEDARDSIRAETNRPVPGRLSPGPPTVAFV